MIMKNIRKIIAVALAATMIAVSLTGCIVIQVGDPTSSDETSSVAEDVGEDDENESVVVEYEGDEDVAEDTQNTQNAQNAQNSQNAQNTQSTTAKTTTTTVKATTTTKKATTTTTAKTTTTTKKTTTTTKATTTTTKKATLTESEKYANAQYWLNYAKTYAKSIGMTVLPGQDGGWDAPIAVEYPSTATFTKRDIEDSLDWYKNQYGINHVQFWLTHDYNNEWELCIGYVIMPTN